MATGGGGQWETTAANDDGWWRPAVMDGSNRDNESWRLATTGRGSHCR